MNIVKPGECVPRAFFFPAFFRDRADGRLWHGADRRRIIEPSIPPSVSSRRETPAMRSSWFCTLSLIVLCGAALPVGAFEMPVVTPLADGLKNPESVAVGV